MFRTCRTRTEQRPCSVRVRVEQSRTRVSMFGATSEQNRTMPLFGSVRCGAELEQTEQDLEMFCSVLFVRLAISGPMQRRCAVGNPVVIPARPSGPLAIHTPQFSRLHAR